jgi:hypothetical protein
MTLSRIIGSLLAISALSIGVSSAQVTIEPNDDGHLASPLTIGGHCNVYSNNNQVSGTLTAQGAKVLASWTVRCTGVVTASMISVYDRYQVQVLQNGTWIHIFDSNTQGSSAYLPNLPPGSYRIVGYNPPSTGSGNFTLTYSSPLS